MHIVVVILTGSILANWELNRDVWRGQAQQARVALWKHRLYACNPEQETCAACNMEGLQKVNAAALTKSTWQQITVVLLSLLALL